MSGPTAQDTRAQPSNAACGVSGQPEGGAVSADAAGLPAPVVTDSMAGPPQAMASGELEEGELCESAGVSKRSGRLESSARLEDSANEDAARPERSSSPQEVNGGRLPSAEDGAIPNPNPNKRQLDAVDAGEEEGRAAKRVC